MDKVRFKYKRYEEIAILKSIQALQGLEVFSKDSLRISPILIYIDNPNKIVVYSRIENNDTRSSL